MNAEINQNHGSGNWIAFLLGAIFNVLASINVSSLLEHALIALIGGVIWLLFQILANRILKQDSKPKSNRKKNVKN
jgi:hypothetical protein